MDRKPRNPKEKLLNAGIFTKSIIQGLIIFIASFGTYFTMLGGNPDNAPLARAMGISIIMLSNLFLVMVNSSDQEFAFQSITRLVKDKVMWEVNIFTVLGLLIILYTPINHYLKFEPLSASQFFGAVGIAAVAVLWYEIVKLIKKIIK